MEINTATFSKVKWFGELILKGLDLFVNVLHLKKGLGYLESVC